MYSIDAYTRPLETSTLDEILHEGTGILLHRHQAHTRVFQNIHWGLRPIDRSCYWCLNCIYPSPGSKVQSLVTSIQNSQARIE